MRRATGSCLVLTVLLCSSSVTAYGQIWELPREAVAVGDHFGSAVAIDGERLVVGASGEDSCGPNSGVGYVYERDQLGRFQKSARLEPSTCSAGGFFGRLVAISGKTVAMASGGEAASPSKRNAVHVFERDDTGRWHEVALLTGPSDGGDSMVYASAIALNGGTLVVASSGDTAAGRYLGDATVYRRVDGTWEVEARLRPERRPAFGIFGWSVSVLGDRIAVAASPYRRGSTGSVFVFERTDDGVWREEAGIERLKGFRITVALAGPLLIAGEPDAGPERAGRISVFGRRDDGGWLRLASLTANVPYRDGGFGRVLAASFEDGSPRIVAAGYTEQLGRGENIDRVVHAFGYDAERGWHQTQVLDLGHWAFGMALDISGRTVVAGKPTDDAPGTGFVIRLLR